MLFVMPGINISHALPAVLPLNECNAKFLSITVLASQTDPQDDLIKFCLNKREQRSEAETRVQAEVPQGERRDRKIADRVSPGAQTIRGVGRVLEGNKARAFPPPWN